MRTAAQVKAQLIAALKQMEREYERLLQSPREMQRLHAKIASLRRTYRERRSLERRNAKAHTPLFDLANQDGNAV